MLGKGQGVTACLSFAKLDFGKHFTGTTCPLVMCHGIVHNHPAKGANRVMAPIKTHRGAIQKHIKTSQLHAPAAASSTVASTPCSHPPAAAAAAGSAAAAAVPACLAAVEGQAVPSAGPWLLHQQQRWQRQLGCVYVQAAAAAAPTETTQHGMSSLTPSPFYCCHSLLQQPHCCR